MRPSVRLWLSHTAAVLAGVSYGESTLMVAVFGSAAFIGAVGGVRHLRAARTWWEEIGIESYEHGYSAGQSDAPSAEDIREIQSRAYQEGLRDAG